MKITYYNLNIKKLINFENILKYRIQEQHKLIRTLFRTNRNILNIEQLFNNINSLYVPAININKFLVEFYNLCDKYKKYVHN